MPAKIYYEINKEHHKKVSCDYHDNKELVLEYQENRYSNFSKKEKDEKVVYAKNWRNNLTEDKKKHR